MKLGIIGSYAKALVMTADRIPQPGETLIGRDYRETYGGKGSDMAVQAARLDADVTYVGVVGDDNFGHEFQRLLADEGIATDGVRVTDTQPTGVGLIVKDKDARNVIVVDMGANGEFSPADIDANLDSLAGCDVALAQLEIPLDTALHAMKRCKEKGVTTVLNPAPAVPLTDVDLSDVDIITPNETEARVCVGLAPDDPIGNEEIAAMLMDRGAGAVVMTLGDKGAGVFTRDASVEVPPFSVDVVDSNGAGDSFNAGLCVALGEQNGDGDLAAAARFASAVGALCCTEWETIPSYHNRKQVDDFLAHKD
ncbi:ribokinase [Bifidobacterium simiarum]|uniref:Ribokinase n=1 Tax=Bifidobacterium simiarum TaxID=2045441 RepID=A0A2M9HCE0_9BIFI|nr:ribokinase [Bifidobacterium simiarum]PJM74474.1 ribokinase [Bifidobacterium simiarum]